MKITLTDVKSGYNLTPLNSNFQAVQTELQDKVLYRDNPVGEPNQMEGPLDLNNNNLMNVNQLDVQTFTIQGTDNTQFLDASVTEAFNWAQHPEDTSVPEGTGSQFSSFHYSLKAEDSATAAQAAETDAELALFNFNGTWYGALDSEPTVDPNGNPPTDGDIYLNSTTGVVNFYLGGVWNPLGGGDVTSIFGRTGAVTALAGDYTATKITYDNATSGLAATNTQAAIDELDSAREALAASLGTASTEDYQEATVSLGGDYVTGTFGQVACSRSGQLVTITGIENFLDHTDGLSQPASADGAIPAWARPATGSVYNLYKVDALSVYEAEISSTGQLTCTRRDLVDGALRAGNTISRPTAAFSTTVAI